MTTSTAQRPRLRTLAEVLCTPSAPPDADPPTWQPADDGPVPEIAPLIRQLLEFLRGRRPPGQLVPWLGPDVLADLEETRARIGPLGPVLRSVHARRPDPDTLEAVAVLELRTGVRAMGMRFVRDDRWRLVVVDAVLTPGDRHAARRVG